MADKILNTRILLKQAELSAWENSTLPLKKGEVVFATVAATAGNGLTEPVVMAKVCTEEGKTFGQLPWSFYAKASDVYDWAKAEKKPEYQATEIKGLEDFIAGEIQDTNTTYSFTIVDNNLVVTPSEGDATTLELVTDAELTTILAGYVTTSALATARGEISAEIDADVKELADGAVKTAQDRADAAYALAETKADATSTTEAINGVKTIAEQGVTDAATAKAAADAAQSDATIAKTKIETFLGTVTPDGSTEIIDTLAEIQEELDRLGGAVELEQQFAAKADKVSGATADNFAGLDANGNLIDSGKKAADFATAEQGAKADTAVQSVSLASGTNNGTLKLTVDDTSTDNIAVTGLGSAAYTNSDAYDAAGTAQNLIDDAVQNRILTGDGLTRSYEEGNQIIYIPQQGVTGDLIAEHSIGAAHLKAEQSYTGDDAEVWILDCGGAE